MNARCSDMQRASFVRIVHDVSMLQYTVLKAQEAKKRAECLRAHEQFLSQKVNNENACVVPFSLSNSVSDVPKKRKVKGSGSGMHALCDEFEQQEDLNDGDYVPNYDRGSKTKKNKSKNKKIFIPNHRQHFARTRPRVGGRFIKKKK